MKRLQLFEFEDLEWWPQTLRNYLTEALSHLLTSNDTYAPIVPAFAEAARRSKARRFIDFCSGSCGPSLAVLEAVNATLDEPLEIVLSDKFPNQGRLQAAAADHPGCSYIPDSVDVLAAGPELEGFRTMFTALHHFRPHEVRRILQGAVDDRAPIALFEFTERSLAQVAACVSITPLLTLASTPKLRPLTPGRLVWTYLLPIVPLTFAWDGVASAMRSYDPEELEEIVASVDRSESYEWQLGRTDPPEQGIPFRITYLIGLPSS